MELYPKSNEAKEYDKARKEFTDTNNKMTDIIHSKTIDTDNINYAKVHTTIYENIGLWKNWRVDKSESTNEIYKASDGFEKVSDGLSEQADKSIFANWLVGLIKSFFGK